MTADGSVYVGRAAVIAMPLPLTSSLALLPPRPVRARAAAGSHMASVIKVNVEYAVDFWRSRGYSGLTISDDGPVGLTYDATLGDRGDTTHRPVLVAFLLGKSAREWSARTPEVRQCAVLEAIKAIFCADAAMHPTRYTEQDWCQARWAGGGYVAVPGPGVLTNYGSALNEKSGVVTWCGTDVAPEWQVRTPLIRCF